MDTVGNAYRRPKSLSHYILLEMYTLSSQSTCFLGDVTYMTDYHFVQDEPNGNSST